METANDTICAKKACKEDGCGNCYVDRILFLFQEHADRKTALFSREAIDVVVMNVS